MNKNGVSLNTLTRAKIRKLLVKLANKLDKYLESEAIKYKYSICDELIDLDKITKHYLDVVMFIGYPSLHDSIYHFKKKLSTLKNVMSKIKESDNELNNELLSIFEFTIMDLSKVLTYLQIYTFVLSSKHKYLVSLEDLVIVVNSLTTLLPSKATGYHDKYNDIFTDRLIEINKSILDDIWRNYTSFNYHFAIGSNDLTPLSEDLLDLIHDLIVEIDLKTEKIKEMEDKDNQMTIDYLENLIILSGVYTLLDEYLFKDKEEMK